MRQLRAVKPSKAGWSYDLSGILAGKALADPRGDGVVYANHAYPIKGDTVPVWVGKMETAARKIPLIVSEFGAEGRSGPSRGPGGQPAAEWVEQVLKALHDHGWSWTAWDLHPAAGPRLTSDWNYTPTPAFGVPVRRALLDVSPREP